MDKKFYKILLNSLQNAGAEDTDIYLNVDLNYTFDILAKERYDNNFDLARQFERERDISRNFRLYGEIASTVIDCNDLTIRLFSDEEYSNEIGQVQTSSVSYGTNNVYGKKKGKYLIELDNYEFDVIYMQIDSDDFYYSDQQWSQRLVFYDSDGEFVSYGSETADVNAQGVLTVIENDFPFFFHKHWVRLDYDIIEEKPAIYSWTEAASTISEGESIDVQLALNKPSPFGTEELTLRWSDDSSSDLYDQGGLLSIDEDSNQKIFLLSAPEDNPLSNFNGFAYVIVPQFSEEVQLFNVGRNIRLTNGDYQGEHTILATQDVEDLILGINLDAKALVLDIEFFSELSNENTTEFFAGSFPDLKILYQGNEVQLPLNLTWEVGEQFKDFTFVGLDDFEIEFNEIFYIEGTDRFRIEPGIFPEHSITLTNSTIPKSVRYNLQNVYENRLFFSGRTSYGANAEVVDDELFDLVGLQYVEGPAILRNGLLWEGRNEEFYPNDFYDLKITNQGIKTVVPENPDLGIANPFSLQPGESFTVRVNSQYTQSTLNSYTITFTATTNQIRNQVTISNEDQFGKDFIVNGCPIISEILIADNEFEDALTYEFWKERIDGSPNDIYVENQVEKPFNVAFDDASSTIVLTSKNPGVKLDVSTTNPFVVIEETQEYVASDQLSQNITLYANSNENEDARYSFEISKPGFKSIEVPAEFIPASEEINDVYLVTGYEDILYPYDTELQQPFFQLNANNVPGVVAQDAIQNQPSYMERGVAYINGAALLSAGIWPESVDNITEPIVSLNDVQDTVFRGAFLPEPLEVIQSTDELIATNGTRGIWRVYIRDMSDIASVFEGTRSFDLNFESEEGGYTWTIGGSQNQVALVRNGADEWWTGSYIPVTTEEGELAPTALQTRFLEDQGSPIIGEVINENTLQFQSVNPGFDFSISNLQNFDGYNAGESTGFIEDALGFLEDVFVNGESVSEALSGENDEETDINLYALRASQIAPSIDPGEVNVGRNGLGGFSLTLE